MPSGIALNIRHLLVLFAVLLATLLASGLPAAPEPVAAAAFVVDTTDDDLDDGDGCSLREAIENANANDQGHGDCPEGDADGDVLTFDLPDNSTITLTAILVVDDDLEIDGSAVPGLMISGGDATQIFDFTTAEPVTVSSLTLTDGTGPDGGAVVVRSGADVTLDGVIVQNSAAGVSGGGIHNSGTLTLIGGSIVRGNTAPLQNIFNRGGGIHNLGTLTLRGSVVGPENSVRDGGGIANDAGATLIVEAGSSVSGNTGTFGAGIDNIGNMTFTDSTLSGNTATSFAGGLLAAPRSTSTFLRSTIGPGNTAVFFAGGISSSAATVTLINSTVSGNTASGEPGFPGVGGGISNDATVSLVNSTVTDNTAAIGAGLFDSASSTINLLNTVVADNNGPDCSEEFGNFNSQGNNLDSDNTCFLDQGSDHPGGTANLGPLANNGGPTQTHALLTGSDAIDAGNNDVCADTDPPVNGIDQRGVARPQEGDGVAPAVCDIGAYELVANPDLAAAMTCQPSEAAPGANVVCTITVTNSTFVVDASLSTSTPPNTTFVSLTAPAGWSCDTPDPGSTGDIFCDPDLPAGTTSTFVLTLQVNPDATPGTVITVEAVVDSPDPNIGPDTATATVTVVSPGAPAGLSVTKVCLGDGFEATFALAVDGGEAQAVECGGAVPFIGLTPGPHTLTETISGPDAESFATLIACDGAATVAETTTSVTVPEDPTAGVFCVVINVFDADDLDDALEELLALLALSALDLEIDIGNTNDNAIGIDNDNANSNANGNSNENANGNSNENANDNVNENAQDQTNEQGQDNANDQTNNVTSSPEVNIDFGE
jgi:CSLREA domain-containing protein